MIKLVLALAVILCLLGCDNVPGQYKHDTKHHDKSNKNDNGKT